MSRSNVDIVQAQLEAYNAQNVDALAAEYAPDIVIANLNAGPNYEGIATFREKHIALFKQHPQNKVTLLNRIALGDTVIDHEKVERSPGGETFHVAAIYTLKGGKIVRTDFVKVV